VPYESWAERAGAPSKHPPVLVDNAERLYAQVPFDASSEVVGRWTAPTLLPGRAAGEFLVFTAPPAGIEYLRLKLPASALGGTSEFRFQVPKSMIEGL
jgi:hypothetical protein